MMEKVREEKALMKEIYDKDIIANKKIASEKDYKPKLNIDLSLYGQDIIEKDLKHLQSKLDNFELDLKSIQDNKYNYQITFRLLDKKRIYSFSIKYSSSFFCSSYASNIRN